MSVNEYSSVTEALAGLSRRGFTANFEYLDETLTSVDLGRSFRPEELTIVEHHRLEGETNPDDMAIVYAIESRDGIRGVLVDAFGPYANPKLGEFLRKVRIREQM
jgi:hypothetical protein